VRRVIEFIGTPGSGKTTLVPTVIAWLGAEGIQAFTIADAARTFASRTRLGKLLQWMLPKRLHRPALWQLFYWLSVVYRIRFLAMHLRLIWQVVSSQRQRPESADIQQRQVLHWFFRMVGYTEFLSAQARPDEAIIVDEGFIHRVVQLFTSDAEMPDPATISRYVNLIPQPELVIAVQAPWEICEQRIYQRGLWDRSLHKEPAQVSQFVAHAHRAVNLTIACIKRQGWPLIEIDNGGDAPSAAQEQLRSKLTQRLPLPSHSSRAWIVQEAQAQKG
jgi:thymidylate kinase